MLDANDLLYLRARYYNPALGVFTALDPLEASLRQLMSLNRYGYVSGNVANRVDPTGMFDWCTGKIESGGWLWQIAREGSPRDATNTQILATVLRIIEANRQHPNYGDMKRNPHLIYPYPTWEPLYIPPEIKAYGEVNNSISCVQSCCETTLPETSNSQIPLLSEEETCSWISALVGPKSNPDQTWINCFNKCQSDKVIMSGNPTTMCDVLECRSMCDNVNFWNTTTDWMAPPCVLTPELIETMTWTALGLIPGMDLAVGVKDCIQEAGLIIHNLYELGVSAEDVANHVFNTHPCLEQGLKAAGKEFPGGDLVSAIELLYVLFDACNVQ